MSKQDVKQLIVDKFRVLSMQMGIKRITIDMLAKECGISKKTVYKFFKSKDEIVTKFTNDIIKTLTQEFEKIQLVEENPELVMFRFFELILEIIQNVPISILQDAHRFYPDIENKINRMREEYNVVFIKTIKRGIKQGVFKNINPLFIEGFYTGAVSTVFNPDFILKNNLTIQESLSSFKTILLTGLLREKK